MLTGSFWYNHGCCHTPCDRQCCLFNMAPEGIYIVGTIIYQWNTSYCLHNFLQWTASLFRGFLSRYSLSSDICIGKSYVLGKLKYPVLYAQECWFVFDHLLAGSGGNPSCSLTVCSMSHSECISSFIITSVSLSAPGPQYETKPSLLAPFLGLWRWASSRPSLGCPVPHKGLLQNSYFFLSILELLTVGHTFLNYVCEDQMGLCLWPQVNLQCLALEILWTVFYRCPFLSFGLTGISAFLGSSFLSDVGRIIS